MASDQRSAGQSAHDPRVLRAIAHPVRNRILTELGASGPMRAADLAEVLRIPANQASFHLRTLAKYGLIEEDPEAARDRRDRVWRMAADANLTFSVADLEQTPGGKAAVQVFRRTASAWAHALVDRAYSSDREPETVRRITEHAVRLTREEAVQLGEDLDAVVDAWISRTRGRDTDRRTYVLFSMLQPYPDDGPTED